MMSVPMTEDEVQHALATVHWQHQQVLAEVGVPRWYWLFMALGWTGLGVLADFGPAWSTSAGTVLFGAVHATLAPHVISGRRGSAQLSVRSELVSREFPTMIIGFLLVMVGATVAIALLLHADGDRHPGTTAGAIVALLVLAGGPPLVTALRARAKRAQAAR